jgi:hypothetical protein
MGIFEKARLGWALWKAHSELQGIADLPSDPLTEVGIAERADFLIAVAEPLSEETSWEWDDRIVAWLKKMLSKEANVVLLKGVLLLMVAQFQDHMAADGSEESFDPSEALRRVITDLFREG